MADSKLSTSAQKVQDALQSQGLSLLVIELPNSTRTASEAARAVGCQIGQIVKTLVFRRRTSGTALLILASGANRVNEKRIAEVLNEPVEKPDASFVRTQTGFAIGGIPPVGHPTALETLIDEDLLQFTQVWAAAGTPHAVFCLDPAVLPQLTNGRVLKIT